MPRILTYALLLIGLALASPALAQKNCVKGKPCGNTCISRDKTCRIGTSSTSTRSTTTRPSSSSSRSSASAPDRAPSSIRPPATAAYVATVPGKMVYYVGCSAWRILSTSEYRFFDTIEEAEGAGYILSGVEGCNIRDRRTTPFERAVGASGLVDTGDICVVSRIIDGDTLACGNGKTIRLLLIDAPENSQGAFGQFATTAMEAIAPIGTRLTVLQDVEKTDPFGRVLAHLVRPDGAYINQEMLRRGMAVVSVNPPNVAMVDEYRQTVDEAQAAKVGLWAINGFECLPEDHRSGGCKIP